MKNILKYFEKFLNMIKEIEIEDCGAEVSYRMALFIFTIFVIAFYWFFGFGFGL